MTTTLQNKLENDIANSITIQYNKSLMKKLT